MRTKYKQWAVDYVDEHSEIALQKIDIKTKFFQEKPVIFEIGSGKGDFVAAISLTHPEYNYLAVEKVKTVAGMMCKKLVDQGNKNVMVFPWGVEFLFESISNNFVHSIYLNFSDPWPKKKHEKRRLTFITFLEQYYRILRKGGRLYFKSDNDDLYEYTKEEIKLTKFKVISDEENYEFDSETDFITEYENKFRSVGKSIHRIILEK
jgi:tRNA (guanine-N7-)-methyltransferase